MKTVENNCCICGIKIISPEELNVKTCEMCLEFSWRVMLGGVEVFQGDKFVCFKYIETSGIPKSHFKMEKVY